MAQNYQLIVHVSLSMLYYISTAERKETGWLNRHHVVQLNQEAYIKAKGAVQSNNKKQKEKHIIKVYIEKEQQEDGVYIYTN